MQLIPNEAKKIEIEGSTVDFFEHNLDGQTLYYFDTSNCGAPEPMVNAMAGLQLLDTNKKLIMINHKPPMGLFPRIQSDFDYLIEELEDGRHKVVFSAKADESSKTDFTQNTCAG